MTLFDWIEFGIWYLIISIVLGLFTAQFIDPGKGPHYDIDRYPRPNRRRLPTRDDNHHIKKGGN